MPRSDEQAARNEVAFRAANEELVRKRRELQLEGTTPFLCECDNESCTELLQLELGEYERVRENPRHFVIVPGHDSESDRLIETRDRYAVVEKTGLGGAIAEGEDPRR
jgi:hypothetical protein